MNRKSISKVRNPKKSVSLFLVDNYLPIFLASFICLTLYDMYFDRGSFVSIFFMPYEPPTTPEGTAAVPIVGQHYFGDFQLPWIMSKGNPYFLNNPLNNIFPLGYIPYVLLSPFGLNVAFLLYCVIAILVYILALRSFCHFEKISKQEIIAFALFNIPLLYSLDRGAIVLVVVSIFTFCIVKILNPFESAIGNQFIYFLMAYCISAKIYLLASFLLIVIGGLVKIKSIFYITVYIVLGNLAMSYVFEGPVSAVKQIIFSLNGATGENLSNVLSNNCVNFASNFAKVFFYFGSSEDLIRLGVVSISLASLLIAILIVRKYRDIGVTILMSLSMIQFFATVSYRYTTIWALFAFLFIHKSRFFIYFKETNIANYQLIKFSLILSLLPLPTQYLSIIPTVWLFVVIRLLIFKELNQAPVSEKRSRIRKK